MGLVPTYQRPSLLREAGNTLFDQMQGRWKTVYTEVDGQTGPEEPDHFLVYKDNTFTVEKGGKTAHDGTFTLDATQNPAPVSYIYKNSFPIYLGGPRAGIIQLEGNTLKCIFSPVGQPAPKDFNTYSGSERVLTVHQRVIKDVIAERIIQTTSAFAVCW
jgi:uncharacterized protein (TIGR03067 family)